MIFTKKVTAFSVNREKFSFGFSGAKNAPETQQGDGFHRPQGAPVHELQHVLV